MRFIISSILIVASIIQAEAQRKYPKAVATVEIQSKLSLKESFEYIVPMDLEHIFPGRYKNIPGIDSTSNQKAWYTPEMHRTVYFDDGSTSQEYLLSVTPTTGFTYKVIGFTSALKRLIQQINGRWAFTEMENGNIHIEWTYEFVPKNFFARFLVKTIVLKRIQVPMQRAMNIMKEELESGNLYHYDRRVGNWSEYYKN